jgi:hypothetical protein
VIESVQFDDLRIPGFQRILLLAGGSILLGLLVTAATLRPDARGFGTHQQLGFPPCTFRVAFGIRCPACGMTTAWAHVVRGKLVRAWQANVGGTLLAVAALVVGPWAVASGLRGRWLWIVPHEAATFILSLVIIVVMLIDWASRYFLAQWS